MTRGHLLVQGVHGHGLFAPERVKQGLLFKCKLSNENITTDIKLHVKNPLNGSKIAFMKRNCSQTCFCPKYGGRDIYVGPFLV